MDCQRLAKIYRRSCVDVKVCNADVNSHAQAMLDKNCMKVMSMMKRSCYQFDKKEEFDKLLQGTDTSIHVPA
jgi:hypothetical protein